jgi:hypothetical protein
VVPTASPTFRQTTLPEGGMLRFWQIYNVAVLVIFTSLVSIDAYAWMKETPDRLFSSALLGGIGGLLWALFGGTVDRLLR